MTTTATAFCSALAGAPALLRRSDGGELLLDVDRWNSSASAEDSWLLDRCSGPVVDLGCGPGRLLTALADRGVPALGIDVSPAAEVHCRRRRVAMVRGDLFEPLPDEGRWSHVLLADGNIGIGGDPRLLLSRADHLLRSGGSVLVETDPDPDNQWRGSARLVTAAGLGEPIPWATIGTRALWSLADALGLHTAAIHNGTRCFVELVTH